MCPDEIVGCVAEGEQTALMEGGHPEKEPVPLDALTAHSLTPGGPATLNA